MSTKCLLSEVSTRYCYWQFLLDPPGEAGRPLEFKLDPRLQRIVRPLQCQGLRDKQGKLDTGIYRDPPCSSPGNQGNECFFHILLVINIVSAFECNLLCNAQ